MEPIFTAFEMEVYDRELSPEALQPIGLMGSQLDLFCGFVSGVAGIAAGHPLDTIRIRQQTAPTKQGTFGRLFAMLRTEGVLSPFRGIVPPLAASGFQNALLFASYAPAQRYLSDPTSTIHVKSRLGQAFLAGCVAGAAQTLVTTPMELVKVRMQTPGSRYSSSLQCMISSVRTSGIRAGLFKGFGVTFLRDCPNIGIYFLSYEFLKDKMRTSNGRFELAGHQMDGSIAVLLAGGTAGMLSWAMSSPIDVIKTRYQGDTGGLYRSARHTFVSSYRAHGPGILFQGFAACMYRAFVVNGATFCAFEESRRLLAL
eukprot:m.225036 g.225036  ORF g.225036 m.225036 type:complete len:313 (-) comp11200_c0_seq1:254-1192(-)